MANVTGIPKCTRRLFIGGLCENVEENELRDRFKSFGQVDSVQIIHRKDEQGLPLKTFAYIDLGTTDNQVKKCLTVLNNTKWKRNILKVQQAKENFLSRLKREWKEDKSAKPKDTCASSLASTQGDSIPIALPGAVPGTPVPGKKNWVVGKFSRVLPVVYLRGRDNKKVTKFDPSKSIHRIKKLRCEDVETPCTKLTWNLDNITMEKSCSLDQAIGKRRYSSGRTSCINNKSFHNSNSSSSSVSNGQTLTVSASEKQTGRLSDNNFQTSGESFVCSFSEENILLGNERKNEGLVTDGFSDSEYSSSDSSDISRDDIHIDNVEPLQRCSKQTTSKFEIDAVAETGNKVMKIITKRKNDVNEANEHLRPRSVNLLLSEVENGVDSDMVDIEKDDKTTSSTSSGGSLISEITNDCLVSSIEENTSSSGSTSDSSSSSRKESDSQNRVLINSEKTTQKNKINRPSLYDSNKILQQNACAEDNKQKGTNRFVINLLDKNSASGNDDMRSSNKQINSNKKRLAAVEERNKAVISRKTAVRLALQSLDGTSCQNVLGKGHIVFGDSTLSDQGNETCTEDVVKNSEASFPPVKKISGSEAASWLGFHSDDSDNGSEDRKDEMMSIKPQFEGKSGEKLFRLQKSFGRDQRFQMDERFLESDDESDGEQIAISVTKNGEEECDTISKQLAEERKMSLAVLQKVLGKNVSLTTAAVAREVGKPSREFGFLHYDPTREDHKQYEETQTKVELVKDSKLSETRETKEVETNKVQVSTEKFYDVNTSSLADLFGQKGTETTQISSSFTFLPQGEAADTLEPAVKPHQEGQMEILVPRPWAAQPLPYDSSSDEDDTKIADDDHSDDDEEMDNADNSQMVFPKDELFFFHVGDQNLANRLNDGSCVFMRTESQEELTQYWEKVRATLTRDYKKKHKDAKRKQSKIAAKRLNR